MKKKSKKTVIVHILRILYCYTSEKYTVSQTDIARFLNDVDIACDRKTVGRNLRYLVEAGVPIKRKVGKNGGYYYDTENDKFLKRLIVEE